MTTEPRSSYTVRIHDEGDGGLWAEVAELPGCFASGQSVDELREALEDAIGLYLSTEERPVHVRLVGRPNPVETVEVAEQRVALC